MNAKDLSNAMNFLDDDLIAECDKVRMKTAAPKKKAILSSLVPVFAAAAAVVVVGAIAIMISSKSDEGLKKHASSDKKDKSRYYSDAMGVDSLGGNDYYINRKTYDVISPEEVESEDEKAEATTAPECNGEEAPAETEAMVPEMPATSSDSALEIVTINGEKFTLEKADGMILSGDIIDQFTIEPGIEGAELYSATEDQEYMVLYIPEYEAYFYLIPVE